MATEKPAALTVAKEGDATQTDVSTSGDGSFCIELYHRDDSASIREHAISSDSTHSGPLALGVVTDAKWANGRTLTVCFFNGSLALRQNVRNIATLWTQFANIRFRFVPGRSADIRITFTGSGGGSQSYVGTWNETVDSSEATMELALDDTSQAVVILRTTLHEFGHALGCIHEHSQPNADINWNRQAVIDDHEGIWTELEVEQNIFEKYDAEQVQSSDFDRFSIMLYPIPASWTDGAFTSGWNSILSGTDQTFMTAMYPFHQPAGDIAAIKWGDSPNEQIRIYYQRSDGYIYEGACSGNTWSSEDTKVVKAKLGTPITALVFDTWNPIALRLYYVNDENRIAEHCRSNLGWTPGTVLTSPSMSANTRLACCGWGQGSGTNIRVYYQKDDATLSTIPYSDGWAAGNSGSALKEASSMSANRLGGDINVYCQGGNSSLTSVRASAAGFPADAMKSYDVPGGTGISAVSWAGHQRVYFVDDENTVCEMRNDGAEWATPPGQPMNVKTSPRGKVAAVVRSTNPDKISVFFLELRQNKITEMAYDGNRWGLFKLPF